MINYHKTYRESLQKSKRKPTPKKQHTINRSHTSSINLKLNTELSQFDPMKVSIKNHKDHRGERGQRKQRVELGSSPLKSRSNLKHEHNISSNSQIKYSFKIGRSDLESEGRTRLKTNYEQSSRAFQDTNRILITDRQRLSKGAEMKISEKSRSKKSGLHLRTEHKENHDPLLQKYYDQDYEREKSSKVRKEMSTKHTTQSINTNNSTNGHGSSQNPAMVKVPLSELKALYEQCKSFENEKLQLEKQLKFYKRTVVSKKGHNNSVGMALSMD